MSRDKILIRLGADLTIKSDRIRAKFQGRLVKNIQDACRAEQVEATLHREWTRMFLETSSPRAVEVLQRVFGIASLSPVALSLDMAGLAPAEQMAAIINAGHGVFAPHVHGKTFAVRVKRCGTHSFRSIDVERELGARLFPESGGVDLRRPTVHCGVEVRHQQVFFYSESLPGPGGLPLGVGGKALCLISGGFDSAVAAWQLQKRGVELDYLFCNLAAGAYERTVAQLVKTLASTWSYGTRPRLHVVDFAEVTAAIKANVRPSHAQVILKRCFYRAANAVAAAVGAEALVTGECLGQVSSQTLRNLCTIEAVSERPVLRPLIGYDKEEIIRLARRIGTYAISAQVQEYCQLVPDKPVTGCQPAMAEREEQGLDLDLIAKAVAARRVLLPQTMSAGDLVMPYIHTEHVPAAAVVIDCRTEDESGEWHYPNALRHEAYELLSGAVRLDKQRTYVLYCAAGLQSAVAAERLQAAGYEAYSFKGGERALQAYAGAGSGGGLA